MMIWMMIKVGVKALWANKLRSFLAMLGLTIGVGSVIAMLGLGAGAQRDILDRMSSLGTNLLFVMPAQIRREGRDTGSFRRLTIEDAEFIAANVEGIDLVTPVVNGQVQVKYANVNSRKSMYGTASTYFPMRNVEIEFGRSYTEGEADARSRVVVLGATLAEELFGEGNAALAVGASVKIERKEFTVVGVAKKKGEGGRNSPDELLYVPYTTAMTQLLGTKYLREINASVASGHDPYKVVEDMTAQIRRDRRLAANQDNDFYIRNQAEILDMASDMSNTFRMLLGGIAGISLLVGGIGIMNVMLVTVTERTREIGVRKAIGARNHDILGQFLFESVLVSGLGGGLGILLGFAGGWALERMGQNLNTMNVRIIIEPLFIWLSFGVAAAVGVFFGFYPAYRASRLDPIEALRYE